MWCIDRFFSLEPMAGVASHALRFDRQSPCGAATCVAGTVHGLRHGVLHNASRYQLTMASNHACSNALQIVSSAIVGYWFVERV